MRLPSSVSPSHPRSNDHGHQEKEDGKEDNEKEDGEKEEQAVDPIEPASSNAHMHRDCPYCSRDNHSFAASGSQLSKEAWNPRRGSDIRHH